MRGSLWVFRLQSAGNLMQLTNVSPRGSWRHKAGISSMNNSMEHAGKKSVGGTIVALVAKANIFRNLESPSYSAKQKMKTICFKVSLYYLTWHK